MSRKICEPIHWSQEATVVKLATTDEWDQLILKWNELGYVRAEPGTKTDRIRFYAQGSGIYDIDPKRTDLFLCIDQGGLVGYYWFKFKNYTSQLEEDLEDEGLKGGDAWKEVNSKARVTEHYGAIYGSKNKSELDIVHNVCESLRPILYTSKYKKVIYENSFKADISSAYPSQSFDLPNAHFMRRAPGQVEPTAEFPFAFYSNGNVKIIERDGTVIDSSLFDCDYYNTNKKKVTKIETVLMARSDNPSLYNYFSQLYVKRDESEIYKGILNYSIGYMRSKAYNKSSYCGHISAVIYARHINRMLNHINDLVAHNDRILMVLTDSILFKGEYNPYDESKTLGKMVLECAGRCIIRKQGQYAFLDDNYGIIPETAHTQGYKKSEILDHLHSPFEFWNMGEIAKELKIRPYKVLNRFTLLWEDAIDA